MPFGVILYIISIDLFSHGEIMHTYTAVIEKCHETNLYVAYVPGFPGAHTQAESLEELQRNLKEVIEMILEDGEPNLEADFIGTHCITV